MSKDEHNIKKLDTQVYQVPIEGSIKQQVYTLLDKNPLLSTKQICALLHLNYLKHKGYVWHLRYKWKLDTEKQRDSKGSKFSLHGWRGFTFIPEMYRSVLDLRKKEVRNRVLGLGWKPTKARNRWILWKDRSFGRLQWFETGRVNVYVRNPVTQARICQLICNGFFQTGIISDLKILEPMMYQVRQKSAHYVFQTNQRLPKISIDLFGKSNGIIIKVGDRTHPSSVEVIASYPLWGEHSENAVKRLTEVLERMDKPQNQVERDISYRI